MNTPANRDSEVALLIRILTDPGDGTRGEGKTSRGAPGPYEAESWLEAGGPPMNTGIFGNADERIVTPGAQGWAIFALTRAAGYLRQRNPPHAVLADLLAEHATELARVSVGSLLTRDHRFAALRMGSSSLEYADLAEAAEVDQAVLIEAFLSLLNYGTPEDGAMLQATAETVIARFSQALPAFVAPQDGVHLWARWLKTLCLAVKALPDNPERTGWRQIIWVLTACLLESQQMDGSWGSDLLSTSQATSALTMAARTESLAARPDTVAAALNWIAEWEMEEASLTLPPPGFRCWEIPLDSVAAILEATHELDGGAPIRPETRVQAIRIGARWRTVGESLLRRPVNILENKGPQSIIRFQRENPRVSTVGDWSPGSVLRLLSQGFRS